MSDWVVAVYRCGKATRKRTRSPPSLAPAFTTARPDAGPGVPGTGVGRLGVGAGVGPAVRVMVAEAAGEALGVSEDDGASAVGGVAVHALSARTTPIAHRTSRIA